MATRNKGRTASKEGPPSTTKKAVVKGGHGKRRSISTNHVQSEVKEDKDALLQRLADPRHKYMIDRVSDFLELEPGFVQESFLHSQMVEALDGLFAPSAKKCLVVFQPATAPQPEEHIGVGSAKVLTPKPFILAGDTMGDAGGEGTVIYVTRVSDRPVTSTNLGDELQFGCLRVEDEVNSMTVVQNLMNLVVRPGIEAYEVAAGIANRDQLKDQFLINLTEFDRSLKDAQECLGETVHLDDLPDLISWNKVSMWKNCACNAEILAKVEALMQSWCKRIELVLIETDLVQKESDNIGPHAELLGWKHRMAKFNYLLEQVKSPMCRNACGILKLAKSKYLEMWQEFDQKITDAANESKDNVKILYSLDAYCRPLYYGDPASMKPEIKKMMEAILIIYTTSQYYNTSDCMTHLFVKITNQMVAACKDYITEKGIKRIWDFPPAVLCANIDVTLDLYQEYDDCFQAMKKKSEKEFDFSEMYTFGKFDSFCKRVKKIRNMIDIIESYSAVQGVKMEGFDSIITKYKVLVNTIQKKGYDFLDQKKKFFDDDYEYFLVQIKQLKTSILTYAETAISKRPTVTKGLEVLARLSKMQISDLDLTSHYNQLITQKYVEELDKVEKIYNEEAKDPRLLRNMPPVSNKIMWAQQLCRKIAEPILEFDRLGVLKAPENREHARIIKRYNIVARALVKYEELYVDAWYKGYDQVKSALKASVLVKHPENGKLYINFCQSFIQLLKESECFQRLHIPLPDAAEGIVTNIEGIKEKYEKMKLIMQEYQHMKDAIHPIIQPLMMYRLDMLDTVVVKGTYLLTWDSLLLESYFKEVELELQKTALLIKDINDIFEVRIESIWQEIQSESLCDLPGNEPWDVDDFVDKIKTRCSAAGPRMASLSLRAKKASMDLIELFQDRLGIYADNYMDEVPDNTPGVTPGSSTAEVRVRSAKMSNALRNKALGHKQSDFGEELMAEFKEICAELINVLHNRTKDRVLRCVKHALDSIKKRLFHGRQQFSYRSSKQGDGEDLSKPFFKAYVALDIPDIMITPSVDTIQHKLNEAVQTIIKVSQCVLRWEILNEGGQQLSTMNVSDHKDIQKVVSVLASSIQMSKASITASVENFDQYNYVWSTNKEEAMAEFLKNEPILSDFNQEMQHYVRQADTFDEEFNDVIIVESVALYTDKCKESIKQEIRNWTLIYARTMNDNYKEKMLTVNNRVNELTTCLNRAVNDLDDVRCAMISINDFKQQEIWLDTEIGQVEDCYSLLNKLNVPVTQEEINLCDTLRYVKQKVSSKSQEVQYHLLSIQPAMRGDLTSQVAQFKVDTNAFVDSYNTTGPMVEGITPGEASERLGLFANRFDAIWSKYITFSGGEELFGLTVTEYPDIQRIKKEIGLLHKLYSLYNDVVSHVQGYYDIIWNEVDIDAINMELIDYQNRCRKLPKAMKDWRAYLELKQRIDDFSECCPLLEAMSDKSLIDRHWEQIATLCECKFDIHNENFLLRNIMEAPLLKHKEDIEDICISAVKEKDIEAKLAAVASEWTVQFLTFAQFKTRGELLLKAGDVMEIVSLMEDSLMVLGSLMSNRYNIPFKTKIQEWVRNISASSEIIESWMVVQNLWVYLEAVFVGGDIAKQLPKEAKRFQSIDGSWQKIMQRAHETTNVIQCCVGDETLGQLLPHLLEQLELCQKSLSGYLEAKRLIFPRFFFVSDPALLEILGQASDSHTIQAHLLNVFDNVGSVHFHEKTYDQILAIASKEDEVIQLETPIMAQGGVEVWLGSLMEMVFSSIHSIIRQAWYAINAEDFEMLKFISNYAAQISLLGIQMLWTRDCEIALKAARNDKKKMQEVNDGFLTMLNTLIAQTTLDLAKYERLSLETIITIHVHQRDIFNELVQMNVKSLNDFDWLKQSRFYYVEDSDECAIRITDVNFEYQNEPLGCTDRLVITPLTDRCYITIAQAMGMSMGAAPAGPAGTGKTETVKDMGRALGKYVVVFNCSDQMDYRGLGRIYKGLAQSGSFGCFDEFNRIDLPVLSVAAQQIHIVLTCKKERKSEFIFSDGDIVKMNPEFGIFLTMNPGYAGRQELPENLKIMFRTVAMMVPDRQIIMCVKLAACGFQENLMLSHKFYTLYKLCEEQLTKQVHYDFGLRNILSVLRTLGTVKRSNPNDSESSIVMRVLRDMNLSKLIDEDEPLFLSLIDDLFPGITLDKAGYPEIEAAIEQEVTKCKLVYHPPWILKLIQLFETQRVRHGMMMLGPTGAGKTKAIKALMEAMGECGVPHREMRMNPKAITAPQMFGILDVATNDWTDGIFSTLWRRTLKTKKGDSVWITLDGPVDAIWIENLNSVLDDNRTLTLANGDRIPMAPSCKVLFEVDNIDNASPATVSRNGMTFLSSSVLDWRPILQGWLNTRPTSEVSVFLGLFDRIFEEAYNHTVNSLHPKMSTLQCDYIAQACNLLQGLIPMTQGADGPSSNCTPAHLERLFVFALMWSLGALLELDDRQWLQEFIQKKNCLDLPPVDASTGDTIFEYTVSDDGEWVHWKQLVVPYDYPEDSIPRYVGILVPNVDNVRTNFLINTISKQDKAVLLIGEQGTAKTVMVKGYMGGYDPEEKLSKCMNFSSASTPGMFQASIESYVEKRMGTTYGPPSGKKMTVFIDDVNMPIINEWGDQITNEIVRQLMEQHGFYNLEKPGDFTQIIDIQFISAMIHPGGGRNDIPSRLKRQFSIFNCTLPSNNSIDQVFSIIGCGYFCQARGFPKEVCDVVSTLVPLTRKLWQDTKKKMLPTPAKFHYTFNLRDLSRIWQGMLNASTEIVQDVTVLISLWSHEVTRVLHDRFTNEPDKQKYYDMIDTCLTETFPDTQIPEHNYFVDFMRDAPEVTGEEGDDVDLSAPKIYEPMASFAQLTEKVQTYQENYNEMVRGSSMDLVFFEDCMTHLIKISRIIRSDIGSALLVGVGGSGKQSVTRMASFVAGYTVFQITLTRSYNISNLMEDLKGLYRIAGLQGRGVTFLFTDNEIKDEAFLEFINNILSSGEVSNLFARDEIDEITNELIPVMKKENPRHPPTGENLYEYFIDRVRKNLHIALCFSPVGEKFRSRALKFPGLISGCTMDWFRPWPKDALIAVSRHFLSNYDIDCTPVIKNSVIESMGIFQDIVSLSCVDYFEMFRRQTYVTPKSYLSFLNGYKEIYKEKYDGLKELAMRMNSGLEKLLEASESVAVLSVELVQKDKDLAVASKEANAVLVDVTQKATSAEKVKAQVQVVKDRAQALVDEINLEKGVAEGKLLAAEPALKAAEAALLTIKPSDIATVRKLAKPPHLIMRIMDCVLLLFQKGIDRVTRDPDKEQFNKPSWGEALKMMAQSTFLQGLQKFPKDSINEETVELLQAYFSSEDYTFESAKKVCGDVAGLQAWTAAMADFYTINKEVLPLKANLIIQEAKLDGALAELAVAQGKLDEKQAELDVVQAIYDGAMKKKQDLFDDAEMCKNRMEAATALINGLSGEKVRWTEESLEFKETIKRLVGDVLIAVAFLSYSGPFNQKYRALLIEKWQANLRKNDIPFTENIDVIGFLSNQNQIGEWNLQGLPNDELSVQNGIICTKASRFPLLVDPQGQGKSWITNKETLNNLVITSLSHKHFRTHLEDALSLGYPLLIEDVGEELDPALDNVLEKNFIKSGSTFKVKVGDKECDVMDGYRMYITSKLPNPAYTPEISARTSIIDFTVTMKGLEEQLLGRVILTEKAELESERIAMLEDVNMNKKKMSELEDNLLYKLTSTQGSLVDDASLIEVLQITKVTAGEVNEKLVIAAETEVKINSAREEFRPVAARGSILYFLITEMSMVNVMYQTSLNQFLSLFDLSMQKSEKSPITSKRLDFIIEHLSFNVFEYTCRGLYEDHKFLFTLLLALKIDLSQDKVKHQEFQSFIKGGAALDLNAVKPKPVSWILDITWLNIINLSDLMLFNDLPQKVASNPGTWKRWFDTDQPEEEEMPDGYNQSLDIFRKLLMIRAWCPDRIIPQARKYIASSLGQRYAEAVILNLEKTWSESQPNVPLICLLSMGSDPTQSIENLAKAKKLECRSISMGQGQEIHARRLLQQFMSVGGWVLLQNCHLALGFLDELLETVTNTTAVETAHANFRIWITTEIHPNFPINFLQVSIKFTNEPPQGLKAGLKRTYATVTQEQLDITSAHQWKPMLYCVAFMHSVVQERRKFGPLGWNIPYEFNQADFTATVQFVQNHLDDMDPKKGVSWSTVCYMIGEVQYGGRVTDDFDKILLNTVASEWFSDNMFSPKFEFYKGYKIPETKSLDQLRNYIETLPLSDTPEVFGLHPNADVSYQSKVAKEALETILNIQPKDSGGGGGETREAVVYRLASEMLDKLPPDYVPFEVRARIIKYGQLAPMNIFLKQEIDRMQRVIATVRNCLIDLKLAIEGTIIMNENLRDALDNMFDARVPNLWLKGSWESSTLGFWFTELLERTSQFSAWIYTARPKVFWMTGFFNPQGFLTAMRQEVTRAHKGWALDGVVLYNGVTPKFKEDITTAPAEGVYVHGLYLDGASWDRKNTRLSEQAPKVLFVPLPVVHMYAINNQLGGKDPRGDPGLYLCPVYKKPRRTDLTFITGIYLPTPAIAPPNHWILRAVALLCDIK